MVVKIDYNANIIVRRLLFIYGPSGVGKTTTIERVVKKLKDEAEQGKIDSFEVSLFLYLFMKGMTEGSKT